MDRLYTSYELFKYVLEMNIIAVGTIKNNCKCIPNEIKYINGRDNQSYKCYREKEEGKISLHSYVDKTKSSGIKNVLLLNSMPLLLGVTKDDGKNKPAIIKFYDFSKGGIDIID